MFVVTGTLPTGEPYRVTWDEDDVTGTEAVIILLDDLAGTEVGATPTGPTYTVQASDGASILAALMAETRIDSIEGDAPDVTDDPEDDEPDPRTVY